MKDPIKAIKTAYMNLLSGTITCNGSDVDFYIGEANKAESTQYIVLNTASTQLVNNKHSFIHEVTVDIDIYSKAQNLSADPYSAVDVIAERIMEAVVISPTTTGLDLSGTDFQEASVIKMDSTSYEGVEDLGSIKVAKRTIVFIQTLTQV